MSFYVNNIPVLGLATQSSSGRGVGFDVGEYYEALLVVHVTGLGGTGGRITPRWEMSPNGSIGTSAGNYFTVRAFATAIKATGISAMTLLAFGRWGRPAWTMGGTGGAAKVQMWFVGRGSI